MYINSGEVYLYDSEICMGCTGVKHYKYRTALVRDIIFRIDRNNTRARQLESWLAERCNVREDNHTAYEVTLNSGKKLYIFCTDSTMAFGLSIEERMW